MTILWKSSYKMPCSASWSKKNKKNKLTWQLGLPLRSGNSIGPRQQSPSKEWGGKEEHRKETLETETRDCKISIHQREWVGVAYLSKQETNLVSVVSSEQQWKNEHSERASCLDWSVVVVVVVWSDLLSRGFTWAYIGRKVYVCVCMWFSAVMFGSVFRCRALNEWKDTHPVKQNRLMTCWFGFLSQFLIISSACMTIPRPRTKT